MVTREHWDSRVAVMQDLGSMGGREEGGGRREEDGGRREERGREGGKRGGGKRRGRAM